MTDPDDKYEQLRVPDRVNNAIAACSHTVPVLLTDELLAARRAWVISQRTDTPHVEHAPDVMRLQDREELFDRMVRVSDGEEEVLQVNEAPRPSRTTSDQRGYFFLAE